MRETPLKEKAFGSFPLWLTRQMQCQEIKQPYCDYEEESYDGSGRLQIPGSDGTFESTTSSRLSSSGLPHM